MGLYSLRQANRSVKLGAILFLLVLGYAYLFAFLMRAPSSPPPAKSSWTVAPAPGSCGRGENSGGVVRFAMDPRLHH